MFDLQKSINDWRLQMLAAGVKYPAPMDELELHLREEIDRLMESGLDEPSAFTTAAKNLGPAQSLRDEFKKVKATPSRRRWLAFEILFLFSALVYPLMLGVNAFLVRDGVFSGMNFGQQVSSVAAGFACSLFTFGLRFFCLRFSNLLSLRIRDALFVPILAWLVVFAWGIMPHCNFEDGTRSVVSLWGFAPFGLLIGWIWAHATNSRKGGRERLKAEC
jgi:fumarate reductase subunit D